MTRQMPPPLSPVAPVPTFTGQFPAPLPLALQHVAALYPALSPYLSHFAYRNHPGGQSQYGARLEFWQRGERDSFNPSQPAIETYGKVNARDVAADIISHWAARGVDPTLTRFYNQFRSSITKQQTATLHEQYKWAQQHENETRRFQEWARVSGLPAYFRGYAFKQWPRSEGMYTPQQMQRFNALIKYLRSRGKK